MWKWLDKTMMQFEKCFNRKSAFQWFVIVIIGLMLRSDHLGVSSIIRELHIDSRLYECLIHFFHANSWQLKTIQSKWLEIVKSTKVLHRENQMPILVCDGVKQGKEGRKMPCVKKHHQESENSSKSEYIFGHLFGVVGVLAGTAKNTFCIPVSASIQDGVDIIRKWENPLHQEASHVVQMIKDACHAASKLEHSILLADRYFLSKPALLEWLACEKQFGEPLLSIVTKAKKSAVAYELPKRKSSKGRPPIKGDKIKLSDLFLQEDGFAESEIMMYGKLQNVKYLSKELLWGEGLYQKLRFVLVKMGETESILVSTDLTFCAEQIIRLYSYRFKIEVSFRSFKQTIAGFSYHFWTQSMPKLNKYQKSGDACPLASITNEAVKTKIMASLKAIEGFTLFSCIALGLLQMLSILFSEKLSFDSFRWLRTKSNIVPSEATVADFMRKTIFSVFHNFCDISIHRIIKSKQRANLDSGDSFIA